jgi:hypothetical protein
MDVLKSSTVLGVLVLNQQLLALYYDRAVHNLPSILC